MKKLEKQNIRDIFALSPMQEGMLYHYLKSPASQHYFEQLCLELNGEIDKDIFEKAWNLVIEANEMLRTVFRWEKVDKPVQVVMKQHTFSPDYYDFSDTPGQDVESLLETVKDTDRKNKFDLRETPFRVTLCKLKGKWSGKLSGKPGGKQHGKPAGSQYQLIISNHHILYDGWSNGILLKEFLDAYNCLLKAGQWVKPFKTSFKEFIKWTQKQDVKRRESYWADYLNGVEGNTPLPVKGEQEKTCSDEDNGRYRRYPGQERMQRLEAFANKNKLTQSTVLYTAWGLLLQRYGACEDMVLGTTVSGRSANVTGIEEMLGLFINTLPFRVNQVPGENTLDMLQRLGRELLDREAFESTPLVEVKEYCGLGMDAQLFDNIMVIENYPLDHHLQNCDGPFRVTSHSMLESTHYPLTTTISFHGEMVIDCLYNPALLEKPIVEQLADHFLFLLEDMINSPHKEPHGLEILPEEEKKCVLVDCNETYTEYPRHKTIHRLFEEQVR
ncbi:MAG: non-ribosomal peptide synthetase, partial [bacterium]|nr:non-ribosomal peptide synthetase [bacterium]